MLRGDFGTAGSVMFLLRLGELLEEWTRKKSLGDLARCMSLNVDRVWQQTAEGEVLVPISQVCAGDAIVVHTGSVIPARPSPSARARGPSSTRAPSSRRARSP